MKRKRDVHLELAHEARPPADPSRRNSLVKRTVLVPVVSSEKGDKIDPVAVQMASYWACLRPSARFALVRKSLRGSCSSEPGWCPEQHGRLNSWLATPIGLVDVTSKLGLRVLAAMRARCMRLVVVADKRKTEL